MEQTILLEPQSLSTEVQLAGVATLQVYGWGQRREGVVMWTGTMYMDVVRGGRVWSCELTDTSKVKKHVI